ncbi:hypothetical protein [Neotamlana laminarinivorans]|uniref:NlpE-like protein n=1 Tax=Neotamlana laminarinivorans TaxID=2883124 RepID=A0A9X1I0P1_9FLAO|nr:hypothetical protein [Tamlana laminarinivorans]MCB4799071.1 hypothetical protein [Tamlana laminarinivorans]
MKKIIYLLFVLIAFTNCKNDTKTKPEDVPVATDKSSERTEKQSDGLTLLKGEFVYFGDAAVLQTHNEIYGVYVTDKMLELDAKAKQYKRQPTDMVDVIIRGKITNKKDDKILWENKVEIVEIINVSKPKESSNVVKLEQ